jgi:hypothetical protein
MKLRGRFDEEMEESDRPRAFLLKSLRATSFHGRQITIPMYDSIPPYFDRWLKFDVTWIDNPTLNDLPNDALWEMPFSEKYLARQYGDLISDEPMNRAVLDWVRYFE